MKPTQTPSHFRVSSSSATPSPVSPPSWIQKVYHNLSQMASHLRPKFWKLMQDVEWSPRTVPEIYLYQAVATSNVSSFALWLWLVVVPSTMYCSDKQRTAGAWCSGTVAKTADWRVNNELSGVRKDNKLTTLCTLQSQYYSSTGLSHTQR